MKVALYAAPDTHLELDNTETSEENLSLWESLIAKMEAMDDDQVREAEAEVYEEFVFRVCPACRRKLHRDFTDFQKEKGSENPIDRES